MAAALKRSEDSPDVFVLRIHEDRGERVTARLTFNLQGPEAGRKVASASIVNSLEEPTGESLEFDKEGQAITL